MDSLASSLLSRFLLRNFVILQLLVVFTPEAFSENNSILQRVPIAEVKIPVLEEYDGKSLVEMTLSVKKNKRELQINFRGESECGYLIMIGVSDQAEEYIVGKFEDGKLSLSFAPMIRIGYESAFVMLDNEGMIDKSFTFTVLG